MLKKEIIKQEDQERVTRVSIANRNRTKLSWERDDMIHDCFWKKFNDTEQKVYDEALEDYESKIDALSDEILELERLKRHNLVEYQMFIEFLSNLYDTFVKADYVRKGKMIQAMCSNIIVDEQKRLKLVLKPWLEYIFGDDFSEFWGAWSILEHLRKMVISYNRSESLDLIKAHLHMFNDVPWKNDLTSKQLWYYELCSKSAGYDVS